MLMLLATSALMAGLSIMLVKVLDTLIQEGHEEGHTTQLSILAILLLVICAGQVQFMNMAIKLYDQLECIPIYEQMVLITWIFVGLVLFHEAKESTMKQLMGIGVGVLCCLVGVIFLTMKQRNVRSSEATPRARK